jgi:hypothetical protein
MKMSENQKRTAKLRRDKWNKAERPYFTECLNCTTACSQTIQRAGCSYQIENCPKKHESDPAFPYRYKEMKAAYDKQQEMYINGRVS